MAHERLAFDVALGALLLVFIDQTMVLQAREKLSASSGCLMESVEGLAHVIDGDDPMIDQQLSYLKIIH